MVVICTIVRGCTAIIYCALCRLRAGDTLSHFVTAPSRREPLTLCKFRTSSCPPLRGGCQRQLTGGVLKFAQQLCIALYDDRKFWLESDYGVPGGPAQQSAVHARRIVRITNIAIPAVACGRELPQSPALTAQRIRRIL